MMEDKWKEICYLFKINKASSEDIFQKEVVNIFEKLGWSRFNNEIEEKRTIDVGAAKSLKPDIIIKNHQKDFFVIELKRPTVNYIERNKSQLFSYMRQLKLNVGLLVNDRIRVFYEDINCRVPIEIMNIEFVENSNDGLQFIKLFSRKTFNQDVLITYCLNHLLSFDAMDYITSEDYKFKIIEFVKNDLRNMFSEDVIKMALNNIDINLQNVLDTNRKVKTETSTIDSTIVKDNITSNQEESEIEKVKRKVPMWLNKPNQTNTRILIKAMEYLNTNDDVSFKLLEMSCSDVERFKGNFDQMTNMRYKNHGKVFEKNGDILKLWEPVREFIKEQYSTFRNEINN